jgi:hypothetical protein
MADETPLDRARLDILEQSWSDTLGELYDAVARVERLSAQVAELQDRLDRARLRCDQREGKDEFFRQGVNDTIDEILRRLKEAGI